MTRELDAAVACLERAGIATARLEAEWLLAEALGVGRFEVYLALDRELPDEVAARYRAAIARRARREPLQHILGWEEFCGLRLRVTADVLVPRPETEALVEWALAWLPPARATERPLALDVGTGSGCIACALSTARPDVAVAALDLSPAALAIAAQNVATLGLGARVHLLAADLLESVRASCAALVVCNPPYLPAALLPALEPEVRLHEPPVALVGGDDGLALVRRVIAGARRVLGPAGALVMETAGAAQVDQVAELLGQSGFVDVVVRADLAGVARLVGGRRPGEDDARPA